MAATGVDDQLLTVADIAARVGAHEDTVRQWIKRGELRAAKFGTRIGWRIKRSDFEAYYERRTLLGAVSRKLLEANMGSAGPRDR